MIIMEDWLPLIITGVFAAFGAAIWAFVSNVLKKFDQIISGNAKKVDLDNKKPNNLEI